MRVDQLLVSQGLAPTRSAAGRLIDSRAVQWQGPQGWVVCAKASLDLPLDTALRITDDAELRYASRGGLKLEGALRALRASPAFGLEVQGQTWLDVGQSTGGFTDVLLHQGAARVVGVDVGHGQLHPRLRADPRVCALEGLHLRELAGSALAASAPVGGFDGVVGDVSFISMIGALPHLTPWLRPQGQALLLIKPQFELGPQHVGKGGVVKDATLFAGLEARARAAAAAVAWTVKAWLDSPITGADGNREFFLWAQA